MTRSKLMLAGMFTLVLGLFTVLPADASAQGWWGQDRRDDRQERREERRERRRDRREDRRERRQDRRNDGVGNDGRYGNYDNYPNYGGGYDARQTALNAGYNEGVKEGREDRQRGEQFEYRDE